MRRTTTPLVLAAAMFVGAGGFARIRAVEIGALVSLVVVVALSMAERRPRLRPALAEG